MLRTALEVEVRAADGLQDFGRRDLLLTRLRKFTILAFKLMAKTAQLCRALVSARLALNYS